jgi:hypothetical protein
MVGGEFDELLVAVLLGNPEGLDERIMNGVEEALVFRRRAPGAAAQSNKRHACSLSRPPYAGPPRAPQAHPAGIEHVPVQPRRDLWQRWQAGVPEGGGVVASQVPNR